MKTMLATISGDSSVYEAARKMRDENVGSLLVEDGRKRIHAIITETDIARKCVAEHRLDASVGDVASKPLFTIAAEADLSDAAKEMGRRGVKRLVVEKDGNIVGIVSQRDVIAVSPALYDLIAEKKAV